MKKIILSIALATIQLITVAQTVNVHFKNGQTIQYPSDNVDYVDFSVKAPDPTVSAGTVVDLGLSVYWASFNLGAESPEEFGDYYSWGETKPKTSYYTKNYSFYDADKDQIFDIGDDISGTEYDAATVNLGSDWRMPTKDEIQELINNCSWEWTEIAGIRGYKVTANNGNSIFLPAAGWKSDTQHYEKNTRLYYSCSTQSPYSVQYQYLLNCDSYNKSLSTNNKYTGKVIRPVTSNPNAGGGPVDHSQDHLVTDKVSASFLGGAYSSINGRIQSGSQLNVRFSNGSSETVTITKIQLGDAETGSEGNNMLNSEVEVAAGEAKSYTVTVGAGGLKTPVIRFTYRYNKKNYVAEATWNL